MQTVTQCKECDSTDLKWHSGLRNKGGVQDGRLRMHEIEAIFYLGCEFCGETLQVVDGDKVAVFLNNSASEMINASIHQLELLLAENQTTYGASERPFKVVESDCIAARIEALKATLKK